MQKNNELMSQKEKDYIASCFNRNLASAKTEIDYDSVLNGVKIEYDLKQNKREIKTIFGKYQKKSRKHLRASESTKTSFLEKEMMIVQFFEIFTILKYANLEDESKLEIENNLISYFKEYFSILLDDKKTFKFLNKFFFILSDDKKAQLVHHLFQNCHLIKFDNLILNFLDDNIEKIPVKASYINNNLWVCDAGFLFGMFLLLKDQHLLNKIVDSFLGSKIVECKFLHKFVGVLFSLCTTTQKKHIEKKLDKHKISVVKTKMESLMIDK